MKNLGFLLFAVTLITACSNDKNSNGVIDSGQLQQGFTYDSRMTATSRVDNGASLRFDEPRFNNNGMIMKLWAYGPIFAGLEGNSFSDHMNTACALLAGPGSRYENHLDSQIVPYGEYGVVLDNGFGRNVNVRQTGRFGDYDLPYWPAENSKYVQSITCANGQPGRGGNPNFPPPNRRRPHLPPRR